MVKLEDIDKLKVNELKAACKEHGLEQSGNKAELAARLKAALTQLQANGDVAAKVAEPVVEASEGSKPIEAAVAADLPAPNSAEVPAATGADAATANGAGKARAKIMFSESEATKFEATKVQVVNTAPVDKPKQLTEAEKLRQRKERFKDPDTERMKQRAQRFNLVDKDLEQEKMLKRAERFGVSHPELEKIKKEQRAARFGIVDEETKKKKRMEKFKPLPTNEKANFDVSIKQDADFEAKRQARAARFAAS